MPNFQQIINAEVRRLARKEVKLSVEPIQKENVALRRRVAELEKKIKEWEKQALAGNEVGPETIITEEVRREKPVRVTKERIIKLRHKLGVTQSQFAELLGVSCHSVSLWESGITSPRTDMKRQIAHLRDLGKRELKALFAEKGLPLNPGRKRGPKTAETVEALADNAE